MSRKLNKQARAAKARTGSQQSNQFAALTPAQGRGSSMLGTSTYQDPRALNEALYQVYCSNPWVRRCVDIIASAMSKGYKIVPTATDVADQIVTVESEPLEAFLNRPNDVDSFETFVGKIARSVVIHGIAFLEVQKVGLSQEEIAQVVTKTLTALGDVVPNISLDVEDLVGLPTTSSIPKMAKLRPAWQMEVLTDKKGNVTGYKQWTVGGGAVTFNLDEIVVILHPSSFDQRYGNSPLEPISTTAIVDNQIRQRQKATFKNQSALDKIFHLPSTTSKENTERFNDQVVARYRGVDAAGTFITVNDDVKVEELSKVEDGSYLKLKQVHKEEICQCLGVPMSVVGETSGTAMNGAGSETHDEAFMDNTVRPLAAHIQRVLNEKVFAGFEAAGVTPGLMDKLITESADDEQALETMYDTGLKNGSFTVNEVRQKRGQEPYKGFGDEPYVFMKEVVPVRNIGKVVAPAAPPVGTPGDGGVV